MTLSLLAISLAHKKRLLRAPLHYNDKFASTLESKNRIYSHFFLNHCKHNSSISYPNDPRIVTYIRKRLTFFRLLSRLSKLDLCGLFFTECYMTQTIIMLKKIQPKSSSVRHDHESNLKKVRSLFDICQYLWVVRVGLTQLYCSSLEHIILMLITAVYNGGSTMYASAAIPNIPHHSSHTQYSPPLS